MCSFKEKINTTIFFLAEINVVDWNDMMGRIVNLSSFMHYYHSNLLDWNDMIEQGDLNSGILSCFCESPFNTCRMHFFEEMSGHGWATNAPPEMSKNTHLNHTFVVSAVDSFLKLYAIVVLDGSRVSYTTFACSY